MAETEFHEVMNVNKDRLYSTIVNYSEYPDFVEGCRSVKIEQKGDGQIRATYHVNVMSQDVIYTLDHSENPQNGQISWQLVESNFFKKNSGKWLIKEAGPGKTDVLYQVEVEFKVPVPGFILNRLVKGSLAGMVKSFEKRANRG